MVPFLKGEVSVSFVPLGKIVLLQSLSGTVDCLNTSSDSLINASLMDKWLEEISKHFSFLKNYSTRVVLMGTTLLGLASGMIGTFMLLRKRALIGDVISHATLPGIALAFIIMVAAGGSGKFLPGLLLGGALTGLLGVGWVMLIRLKTRVKEDAALGIVLSVFFGLGIALLGVIQKMSKGSAAGLSSFIYGKTASMLASDARLIALIAFIITLLCICFYKEFKLLCFDKSYAKAQGWPVGILDGLMMLLVIGTTVIGLQSVGLILIIALLVIPPAAARFWTYRLHYTLLISSLLGGLSCAIGVFISALLPRLPTGALIVVIAFFLFFISMLFGKACGVIPRWKKHFHLSQTIAEQHLFRALYECMENTTFSDAASSDEKIEPLGKVSMESLLEMRSWSPLKLACLLKQAKKRGEVDYLGHKTYRLTKKGQERAYRIIRNHRLWELYLITHADVAPGHVDRDADQIEHVLGQKMVQELESLLTENHPDFVLPDSPHPVK